MDPNDYVAWEYIEKSIDCEALMKKYAADGMVFMVFLNTDNDSSAVSCTRAYYEGMEYPYEVCYIYMHCDGEEETPSGFAHEILHTFGAPDLYLADTDGFNYGITQEYVDGLFDSNSNDIMFICYDVNNCYAPVYDRITNEFTEIDAYYTGLSDRSDTVENWGFEKSQH